VGFAFNRKATFLVFIRKADSLLHRQTVGDWLYGVPFNTAPESAAASC
jgi:hypothetical protein